MKTKSAHVQNGEQKEAGSLHAKCPFLQNPRHDCYCASTSSSDVEKMIKYCNDRYGECKIYQERLEEESV